MSLDCIVFQVITTKGINAFLVILLNFGEFGNLDLRPDHFNEWMNEWMKEWVKRR